MGKKCPYPALYEKTTSTESDKSAKDVSQALPIDDYGTCIFHSHDIAWKRDNDFKGHFLKIVEFLNADDTLEYYDFNEFHFVGNELRTKPGSEHHVLSIIDMICRKQAYFIGAVFSDAFELKRIDFKDGANFDRATFSHDLRIQNVNFRGVGFINAKFEQHVFFSKVEFLVYALFTDAKFTGSTYGYGVKFEDSDFKGITDFSGIVFDPQGNESTMGFQNVQFEDCADFKNARFHNQIIFGNVSFASITEFTDTLFDTAKSSARYRGVAVEFNQIEVKKEAVLLFKSTDPQKKLFNHDVQMSFKEDPTGLIKFENVNFSNFTSDSKDRLTRLAKSGRVEVGSGCIKYRFQTEIQTISVSQGNAPLILELCQTFTNYFTVSNGLNLGFEIVERKKTEVSFFYFTDENISETTFHEQLAKTEKKLWSLLSTSPEEQYLALEEPTGTENTSARESSLINTVDGITALLGTLFRVGARIACGTWKGKDTESLLNAIHFHDRGIANLAQSLHRVLVDKYTGETLFAFNLQQNQCLAPLTEITYNLTGPNARVYHRSADNSTNVVNINPDVDKL